MRGAVENTISVWNFNELARLFAALKRRRQKFPGGAVRKETDLNEARVNRGNAKHFVSSSQYFR